MSLYPKNFIESRLPKSAVNGAFLLMPFASEFDDVHASIREACEKPSVDLICKRADDFYGPGAIMEDILAGIFSSEYVIADLTGKNPNVFYELGIAHSCKSESKVIILSQRLEDVPFDLRHKRCIVYKNGHSGLQDLIHNLEGALLAGSEDFHSFSASENVPFQFTDRLSGVDHDFYTFTLDQLLVASKFVKFKLTVHRESISQESMSYEDTYHYLKIGDSVAVPHTYWKLRLESTDQDQGHAVFDVRRGQIK